LPACESFFIHAAAAAFVRSKLEEALSLPRLLLVLEIYWLVAYSPPSLLLPSRLSSLNFHSPAITSIEYYCYFSSKHNELKGKEEMRE
jgi:hypothetical protein